MSSRAEQRDRLLMEFGKVIDPVVKLLQADPPPSKGKIDLVSAQYYADYLKWVGGVAALCTVNGLRLERIYAEVCAPCNIIKNVLNNLLVDREFEQTNQHIKFNMERTFQAVREIPADDPDVLVPPQSPYSAYSRLHALCAGATRRIHIFDQYLDAPTFLLYLGDAPGVEIKVVTSEETMNDASSRMEWSRRERIVAVSTLMSIERPDRYHFLDSPGIHDRHMRIDEEIFHLGSSSKDAAKRHHYTITGTDSNAALHASLDGIIAGSRVWYQPGMDRHRRWCSTCQQPVDTKPNWACVICNGFA